MPATSVDLVIARALWGAFQPHSGPLLLGCYRPTSVLGFLMWFGRTWWGRAGPKVISRAVTSETHFPTIKEREKLSGPNIACFHGIESNICMCVSMCVCVLYIPATITPRHARIRTLLSHPKTVTEHFQMCLLTTKTAWHQNMTHIQTKKPSDTKSRETGGRVGKKGTTFAHLCYSQCRICLLNRVETPFHRVCLCVCVCVSVSASYACWAAPSRCSSDIKHKAASGAELIAIWKRNQTNSTH